MQCQVGSSWLQALGILDGRSYAGHWAAMNPGYLFPENQLSAWVRDCLCLRRVGDKWIAEFRWTGATCTEPVRVLEFLFEVNLKHTQRGYRIQSSHCRRPDGKGAWRRMCSSQTEPDFLKEVEEENPFEGRMLEEALAWRSEVHPAGCLCSWTSRAHKWQIVFQTIHYALRRGGSGPGISTC